MEKEWKLSHIAALYNKAKYEDYIKCDNPTNYRSSSSAVSIDLYFSKYINIECDFLDKRNFYWNFNDEGKLIYNNNYDNQFIYWVPDQYDLPDTPTNTSEAIPFPQEILNDCLREYGQNIADDIEGDADNIFVHLISFMCVLIGPGIKVEILEDFERHLNVLSITTGDSSQGKTAGTRKIYFPLRPWEIKWQKINEKVIKQANEINSCIDMERKELIRKKVKINDKTKLIEIDKNIGELEAKRVPIPPSKTITLTNTTPESYSKTMSENNGSVFIMSSDGKTALKTFFGLQYKGKDKSYVSQFCDDYTGSYNHTKRVGSGSHTIESPCPNTIIDLQPYYISEIVNVEHSENGLISRIMFYQIPKGFKFNGKVREIDKKLKSQYEELANKLLKIHSDGIEGKTITIPLSAKSKKAYRRLKKKFSERAKNLKGQNRNALQSWLLKAAEQTAKFACVLAIVNRLENGRQLPKEVRTKEFNNATKLIEFFYCQLVQVCTKNESLENTNKRIILKSLFNHADKYTKHRMNDKCPAGDKHTGVIVRRGDVQVQLSGQLKNTKGKNLSTREIDLLLSEMAIEGVLKEFYVSYEEKKTIKISTPYFKLRPEVGEDFYG